MQGLCRDNAGTSSPMSPHGGPWRCRRPCPGSSRGDRVSRAGRRPFDALPPGRAAGVVAVRTGRAGGAWPRRLARRSDQGAGRVACGARTVLVWSPGPWTPTNASRCRVRRTRWTRRNGGAAPPRRSWSGGRAARPPRGPPLRRKSFSDPIARARHAVPILKSKLGCRNSMLDRILLFVIPAKLVPAKHVPAKHVPAKAGSGEREAGMKSERPGLPETFKFPRPLVGWTFYPAIALATADGPPSK